MKISMIGSGRWGTFITWYLDSIGHTVKLYGPADTPHMQALLATRSNGTVTLPESVELVCDIHALADADVIGISVPSQALHSSPCEMPVPLHVVQVMDFAASSPSSAASAHTLSSDTAMTTSSRTARILRLEFILKFLP